MLVVSNRQGKKNHCPLECSSPWEAISSLYRCTAYMSLILVIWKWQVPPASSAIPGFLDILERLYSLQTFYCIAKFRGILFCYLFPRYPENSFKYKISVRILYNSQYNFLASYECNYWSVQRHNHYGDPPHGPLISKYTILFLHVLIYTDTLCYLCIYI